jgi:hypothetical protein
VLRGNSSLGKGGSVELRLKSRFVAKSKTWVPGPTSVATPFTKTEVA